MSGGISGKVGSWDLKWVSVPRGSEGSGHVELRSGGPLEVRWRRDPAGIWIETADGVFGFDIFGESDDDGGITYRVARRGGQEEWAGLAFVRAGEAPQAESGGTKRRGARVKAQMPGKIVRVLVKDGQTVEKGESLVVMEAMKMENEIRAHQGGRIATVRVVEGQAVETGAELLVIEAE